MKLFDKNYEDGGGTPVASIIIGVCAQNTIGQISANESKLYVSNPVPAVPDPDAHPAQPAV